MVDRNLANCILYTKLPIIMMKRTTITCVSDSDLKIIEPIGRTSSGSEIVNTGRRDATPTVMIEMMRDDHLGYWIDVACSIYFVSTEVDSAAEYLIKDFDNQVIFGGAYENENSAVH